MRKFLYGAVTVTALLSGLLFSGCAGKQSFEPEEVHGSVNFKGSLDAPITEVTRSGATLQDGSVITAAGSLHAKVLEGYRFLNATASYMTSAKNSGALMVTPLEAGLATVEFDFEKPVAAATAQEGVVAVLFTDNALAIYSLDDKKLLFKQPGESSIALDMRTTNPYFLNDLVIFPTLDGKLVIVERPTAKVVRSIVVSSDDFFNNVIYFHVVGETLVAATPHAIFTLGKRQERVDMDIRDVIFTDEGIWVATKDGKVLLLDSDLGVKGSIKLPFAHYMGMVVKDNIYVLEKEGYLIEAPKDLSSYRVLEIDIPEGLSYVSGESFIVNDEFLTIQ